MVAKGVRRVTQGEASEEQREARTIGGNASVEEEYRARVRSQMQPRRARPERRRGKAPSGTSYGASPALRIGPIAHLLRTVGTTVERQGLEGYPGPVSVTTPDATGDPSAGCFSREDHGAQPR